MSHIDTALRRAAAAREAEGASSILDRPGAGGPPVPVTTQDYQSESVIVLPNRELDPQGLDHFGYLPEAPAQPVPAAQPAPPAATVEIARREEPAPAPPSRPIRSGRSKTLLPNPACDGLFIEQYRRLAATLYELQEKNGLKTILVSSALPGEGKTSTCVNLALTLSRSYRRRVLLVDGDLRRPSLHEAFGVPAGRGLAHEAAAPGAGLPMVQVAERITLVPAGRPDPNPTAILASDHMRNGLAKLALRFDWVIVDSPPLGLIADANLMARMVDGVVLVIAAGRTPFELTKKAVDEIGRERIVGAVLNKVETGALGPTTYYHHQYVGGAPSA